MKDPDWTDSYTHQHIAEVCTLPPDGPWIERMKQNPVRRGTYWVRWSDNKEELLNYGTSRKWDNGRERIHASVYDERVTHWKAIPRPTETSVCSTE